LIASGQTITAYASYSSLKEPFSGGLAYSDSGVGSGVDIGWSMGPGGSDPDVECSAYGPESGAYECTGFSVQYPNQQTWPITATVGCPGASGICPWAYTASLGSSGKGPGQFDEPTALDQNGCTGQVYVADSGNARWQYWEPPEFVGSATDPGMPHPVGITVANPCSNNPQIVVADDQSDQILTFTPGGQLIATFGAGTLSNPQDVSSDLRTGNLFVADTGNNRIVVYTVNGDLVGTIGSTGVNPGQFQSPRAVDVEQPELDQLAVADSGNGRLQLLQPNGSPLSTLGFAAQALGYTDSYLVAAAGPSVALFNTSSNAFGTVGQFGATGTGPGRFGAAGAGDGGGAYSPGVFYLADPSNDRFQVFFLPSSLSRLASRSARVRGGRARVPVRCLEPRRRCQGSVTLYRRGRALGRGAFSLPARGRGTVSFPLDATGRRALADGGALRTRAALHGRGRAHTTRAAGQPPRYPRREVLEIGRLRLRSR
jgi:hypothetical protein